jgi:nucleoside 2-deoxyribosyltransferase
MKVFLAAPFSNKYNKQKKEFDASCKYLIMCIIELLEKEGFEVFSSHVLEEWGNKLAPPDEYLPRDIEELKKSDIMIALIDENTPGVYVELGWGYLFRKRMIVLTKADMNIPEFIGGILEVNKVDLIYFNSNSDLLIKFSECLTEIIPNLKLNENH